MKNFLKIFLFLFFISVPFTIFAGTEVYVYPVATQKPSYEVGDTIKGQFTIHNVRATRQSDIVYTIGFVQGTEPYGRISGEQKYNETLYLEANSKRNISFNYTLPSSASGRGFVVVTVLLTDGTSVGQGNAPIVIAGAPVDKKITLESSYIENNSQPYSLENGPNVSKDDKTFIIFTLPKTSEIIPVSVSTQLFNRTQISEPLKVLDTIKIQTQTSTSTVVRIPLPVDMDPLVYAGETSFSIQGYSIDPIQFRYVIDGEIATIRNINSDKLSVKKNKGFVVEVTYAGTPINFNNPEQASSSEAILNGFVLNENEEKIASFEERIDLINQANIKIPLKAEISAKSMSFAATITSLDGRVLSTFSTELPSEEELAALYQKSFWETYKNMINLGGLILLLGIILIFLKKRKNSILSVQQIVTLGMVGTSLLLAGQILAQASSGYTIESGSVQPRGIEVNALYSPLPPSVRTYAPGEYFDIVADVRFGADLRTSALLYLYMPNVYPGNAPALINNLSNWTSENISYPTAWWNNIPPADKFNLTIPDGSVYTYDNTTLKYWFLQNYDAMTGTWLVNSWGGNVGGDYVSLYKLALNISNPLLDLRKLVFPNTENKVFATAVTDGRMVDTQQFDNDLQYFFAGNSLGHMTESCWLRDNSGFTSGNNCPNTLGGSTGIEQGSFGNVMLELFPPVWYTNNPVEPVNQFTYNGGLEYPVLISKWRSYENGTSTKPFTFELENFQGMSNYATYATNYYLNDVKIRELYEKEGKILPLAAKLMKDYQLEGWEDANSFDFGFILTPKNTNYSIYGSLEYTVTKNASVIDSIATDNFNSPEFNTAVKAILDFLFYYNEKFYDYTRKYKKAYATPIADPVNIHTSLHSRLGTYGLRSSPYNSHIIPPLPVLPAIKKAYFYMYLDNGDVTLGLNDQEMLISQSILISSDNQGFACPNLTIDGGDVYTEDENGLIYKNGSLTNLEKDLSGNCVEPELIISCNPNQSTYNINEEVLFVATMQGVDPNATSTYVWTNASSISETSATTSYAISGLKTDVLVEIQNGINVATSTCSVEITNPPINAYCTGGNVAINQTATYTAYPSGGTYQWRDENGVNISGATSAIYSTTFQSAGTYPHSVVVTKNSVTETASCSSTVGNMCTGAVDTCQNNELNTVECVAGSWVYTPVDPSEICQSNNPSSGGPSIINFNLSPSVIADGGSCYLTLEASNVQSCRLFKSGSINQTITNSINNLISEGSINTSASIPLSIGSYQVGCTGTSTEEILVSALSDVRKCISNPNYKER